MLPRLPSLLILALGAIALAAGDHARAHGVLVPTDRMLPPLGLAHHRVEIAIDGGLATVTIDQTWRNTSDRPLEATYLFPVPKAGVVTGFELEVNGKMQKGEMLERDKARRIYEDIVARMRDPGLVEWMERDLFQVRIFPVPARGEQRLRLRYAQPLETLAGTYRLTYPLRTSAQAARTLEDFTLTVRIRDAVPVGTVYSPTHKIAVSHRGHEVIVGFEDERVLLDKDFVLYFGVSTQDIGISAILHRERGEPGFFLLTAAPRAALESSEVQGKNVIFVLDTSGSMTGDKIVQAKAALRYCIDRLGADDRFDVLRFSSDVERLSPSGLVVASEANKRRALDFVDDFEAAGGTAIDEALRAAIGSVASERGALILFVTDGRPTVGEVDAGAILDAASRKNSGHARIFTMGVGEDLDTHLVDLIADRHGGTSHYVRPGEDVKVAISALYEHIAYPVLSDVTLTIDGVRTYAVLPQRLPDLFRGQQLVVAGRYRDGGKARVRLEGRLGKETRRFEITVDFPEEQKDQDFVASIWAHRQVGQLLDQIRLTGETTALREEVVQLAKRYGIVTPYTSWLVVDDREIPPPRPHPDPWPPHPRPPHPRPPRPIPPPWLEERGGGVPNRAPSPARAPTLERKAEEQERIVLDASRPAAGAEPSSQAFREDGGKTGVDAAETIRIMKDKDDEAPIVRAIRRVFSRVFAWDGHSWLDQAATAGLERVDIKTYSPAWSELAKKGADVRAALALGERVQIRIGDTLYVVSP